jgi:ubiquinone/menaquinone biosynthesis C-methylase UbiE
MSLRGRYIIDRIKNVIGGHFKLPCPPYADPEYWNAAYMSLGSTDCYEWGDITLKDLHPQYKYHPVTWDIYKNSSSVDDKNQQFSSSLADAINILPPTEKQRPILMLGCGNSKFGEEMIDNGWKGLIIQVDVSSRVIDTMSQRCTSYVQKSQMSFVQDDACELSAFRDGMIDACIDKGLIDAVYCADEYKQLPKILKSISRVLKPGGSFVFFSFSRPEYILPRLMVDEMHDIRKRQWVDLQVHQLDKILLYKMKKINLDDDKQLLKFNKYQNRQHKKQ